MLTLILLYVIATLSACIAIRTSSKSLSLLTALPTYFFAASMQAFRVGGSDWDSYRLLFEDISNSSNILSAVQSGIALYYEPGLPSIYYLISSFGGDYRSSIYLEALMSFFSFVALSAKTRFALLYLILSFSISFANTMGVRINLATSVVIILYCLISPNLSSAFNGGQKDSKLKNNLGIESLISMMIPLLIHIMSILVLVGLRAEKFQQALSTRASASNLLKWILTLVSIGTIYLVLSYKYPQLSPTLSTLDIVQLIGAISNALFGLLVLYLARGAITLGVPTYIALLQIFTPTLPFLARAVNLLFIGLFISVAILLESQIQASPRLARNRGYKLIAIASIYFFLKTFSLSPLIESIYNPCFYCSQNS